MIVNDETNAALDLKKLRLPSSPRVVSIHPEKYVDSSGENALRIWVVLSEDTDEGRITGEASLQIKSAIRRSLRTHGISYFPYIFFMKEEEFRTESEAK